MRGYLFPFDLQRKEDLSSSLCVQTSSETHPASYPMGRGVLSLGIKHGRGVTLTNHPQLVARTRISSSCTSLPLWHLYGDSETALLSLYTSLLIFPLHSDRQSAKIVTFAKRTIEVTSLTLQVQNAVIWTSRVTLLFWVHLVRFVWVFVSQITKPTAWWRQLRIFIPHSFLCVLW
jgi:hypothetical protein